MLKCLSTSGVTSNSPCSIILCDNSAMNGASLLPHRRSDASHTVNTASLTSSPYTGGRPRLSLLPTDPSPDRSLTAVLR